MGNVLSSLVGFVQSQPYVALFVALAVLYGIKKGSPTAPGATIECLYPGKTGNGKDWLKAKLLSYNSDGETAKVQYFDGDVDEKKPLKMIHFCHGRLGIKTRKALMGLLGYMVGDSIECRFGGKEKYYPGAISGKNSDGTFNIRYNDSDEEKNVKAELIKFRKVTPVGVAAKKTWPAGKGQAHIDSLGDEKAMTRYFVECMSAGIKGDMVLMLADNCQAKLKEHEIKGKANCEKAVEKILEKSKGYLRLTGKEEVDTLEAGKPLKLQMKYKAIFGIGVQTTLHWENKKIVFLTMGRA